MHQDHVPSSGCIESVHLCAASCTAADLRRLPATVRELTLSPGATLTRDAWQYLGEMPGLRSFTADGGAITDGEVRLLARSKTLTSLTLRNCRLGALAATRIALMPSLRTLDLEGNQVGPLGARAIAISRSITRLNLAGNNVGAMGAQHIARMPALAWLNLADNNVGDFGAAQLRRSTSITTLNLSNNGITQAAALLRGAAGFPGVSIPAS